MSAKIRSGSTIPSDEQSPPKKPRIQPPQTAGLASLQDANARKTFHTHAQIWNWTLTPDAIAPCRIEDIFALQECEDAKVGFDSDYYWLGRVPCRSVRLYGIVVGVQQYDQRTVYSVDDGTGSIECNLRHSSQQILGAASPGKSRSFSTSKYQPNTKLTSDKGNASTSLGSGITGIPKPIAFVGDITRVEGRVLNRHYTRIVNVDKLVVCRDPTEEPLHFLAVANLHKCYYRPAVPNLFAIPRPTARETQAPSTAPSSFLDQSAYDVPSIQPPLDPSSPTKSSVASSAPSTPTSNAGTSAHGPQSPPRLRHPSRLHTRDLTANTFRIYVKHYMDNAPQDSPQKPRESATGLGHDDWSDDEDDLERLRAWLGDEPQTPTKRKVGEATPRPNRPQVVSEQTPRATGIGSRNAADHDDAASSDRDTGIQGFTLSHLRRVPELSLLARRVVDAEFKRRAREDAQRLKEAQNRGSSSSSRVSGSARKISGSKSSTGMGSAYKPSEPKAAKMKRLFRYAIRQLYDEGSIVLWDGPIRTMPLPPLPALSFSLLANAAESASAQDGVPRRGLWKFSSRSKDADKSNIGSVFQSSKVEVDDGELSDPPEEEDAYIPLTPAYLCKVVETAITTIQSRSPPRAADGRKAAVGPTAGPTPDEIVNHLHRRDERWARVGNWAVKDALEWGRGQGRVWCIGDNRWEVCG